MNDNTPEDWHLLKDAPTYTVGLLWCPELRERTDTIGMVYESEVTKERWGASSMAHGFHFTHWHPLPKPPR